MKSGIACLGGAAAVALSAEASAHEGHFELITQAEMQACASSVGSIVPHQTVPAGSNWWNPAGTRQITIPPAPNTSTDSCATMNWVRVMGQPTNGNVVSFNLKYAGRTTVASAWDCQHSSVVWGLFRKSDLGVWQFRAGSRLHGSYANGECSYQPPGGFLGDWGSLSFNDDVTGMARPIEYRAAFVAWSHDDPLFGHTVSYCDHPTDCYWPMEFNIVGNRPFPQSDFAHWVPPSAPGNSGTWRILDSTVFTQTNRTQGATGDRPAVGDFDADGYTDLTMWRPSTGAWSIFNSWTGTTRNVVWGVSTDVPVPADYTGDGATDITVFRPSTQGWIVVDSRTGTSFTKVISGSQSTDVPAPADYDGDFKADPAVFRPSNGTWLIQKSVYGLTTKQWGQSGDIPVPGDYDGDGMSDIAVWRPSNGTWYYLIKGAGNSVQWGQQGDVPVAGDYNGDGKTDFAVWRPSQKRWYVRYTNGNTSSFNPPAGTTASDKVVEAHRIMRNF